MTDRSAFALLLCLSVAAVRPPDTSFAQQAAPQQTPAPAAQAQPVARVPVVNRANEALPAWLRVRGEFRERMEGFDGLGFNETREDLYWLSRFRFNAIVTPSKFLSFQAQVQDVLAFAAQAAARHHQGRAPSGEGHEGPAPARPARRRVRPRRRRACAARPVGGPSA